MPAPAWTARQILAGVPRRRQGHATTRDEVATEVYERLFGPLDSSGHQPDPELGEILRGLIFGDVFAVGDLDDRTRELVTVTVLATMQTLPQLRSHAAAALKVGVEPIELREAIYQLAPFIGFPRTLNAVGVLDEVLEQHGHTLPLPDQGTVSGPERYERGAVRFSTRSMGMRSAVGWRTCRTALETRWRAC